METDKNYYYAYEQRYQQVHREGLQWASDVPTPIVRQTIERYELTLQAEILEIGCGEGRDETFDKSSNGSHATIIDGGPCPIHDNTLYFLHDS